jgi:hypothetical protein
MLKPSGSYSCAYFYDTLQCPVKFKHAPDRWLFTASVATRSVGRQIVFSEPAPRLAYWQCSLCRTQVRWLRTQREFACSLCLLQWSQPSRRRPRSLGPVNIQACRIEGPERTLQFTTPMTQLGMYFDNPLFWNTRRSSEEHPRWSFPMMPFNLSQASPGESI